jgi:hypothetical protein
MTDEQKVTGKIESASIHGDSVAPSSGVSKMPIHFIKSSQFRVVHATGVWYGGDSQQNLHLTFFNERTPIPKKVILILNQQGLIVSEDESQREAKQGVVREMEVDIVLSVQAALDLHKTLGDNLRAIGQKP